MNQKNFKLIYLCGEKVFESKEELIKYMELNGEKKWEIAVEEEEFTPEEFEAWPLEGIPIS